MTTRVDVINQAAANIGAATITALTETSETARKGNLFFEITVRSELRKHAWNFAMARDNLAITNNTPAFGYAYEYNLPTDFLRLWTINEGHVYNLVRDYEDGEDPVYVIEGRKILTDLGAPLKIRYIKDKTNVIDDWDAIFLEAVSYRLSMRMTPSLARTQTKFKDMKAEYNELIRIARRTNAIELPPQPLNDGDWTFGRT